MEILILNASPRAEGSNTLQISHQFVEGIKSEENETKLTQYNLVEKNIQGCKGCFACWNSTDHTCPIKDDMPEMLKSMVKADLIIWSVPLYLHTMTGLAKTFIERILPLASPFIVHDGEKFTHPYHTPLKAKHLLVSSCGFPEYHNFNNIISDMKRIFEDDYMGEICCVMGELFRLEGYEDLVKAYKKNVYKAGKELIAKGAIEKETVEKLKRPLAPVQLFVEKANEGWNNQDTALLNTYKTTTDDPLPVSPGTSITKGPGYAFLENMQKNFNKENGLNMDGNLAFHFTDIKEESYFSIKGSEITLTPGTCPEAELKIITDMTVWQEITSGKKDGAEALMNGDYHIQGNVKLLQNIGKLFSSNKKAPESAAKPAEKKKLLGIPLDRWLTIGFMPWISSWILSNAQPALALIIPAVISCILLCIKKAGKQTTFFELTGFLYFGMLSAFQFLTPLSPQEVFSPAGISMMHYFALATIWFSSIFLNTSLTADYSRHTQDDYDNPIFHLTNEILCIFWSLVFILQAFLFSILAAHNLNAFSTILLVLIIPAGKFTGFFANWYPDYLMKGGKLRLPWY